MNDGTSPTPETINVSAVQSFLRNFASERDWNQFHTPKNIAMAVATESGELIEIFQWLTPEQSAELAEEPRLANQVRDELADILQYIIRLADLLSIDLNDALWNKLKKNESKYPTDQVKGSAKKYTEY